MTDTISSMTSPEAGAVVAPPRRRRRGARPVGGWRRSLAPWLYLAVPLTLLIALTYVPVANMLQYSFQEWDGVSPDREWVGSRNYVNLFTRPELFSVFSVSLYYLVGAVVQMVIALYFATVLSFDVRFRGLFKGILFFPYLINGVAIAFVFLYFFKPGGTLDSVLALVGVEGEFFWLGDRDLVNPSLVGVSIWRYLGLNFVLFLGAIQSIPSSLYEAAELDRANKWQQFRHIILPNIKPILSLSFILAISGSLAVFEVPFIMTGGANGSETFVIQTIDLAFESGKVGLASAAAVVLLVLILLITWVQRLLVPEEKVDLA